MHGLEIIFMLLKHYGQCTEHIEKMLNGMKILPKQMSLVLLGLHFYFVFIFFKSVSVLKSCNHC